MKTSIANPNIHWVGFFGLLFVTQSPNQNPIVFAAPTSIGLDCLDYLDLGTGIRHFVHWHCLPIYTYCIYCYPVLLSDFGINVSVGCYLFVLRRLQHSYSLRICCLCDIVTLKTQQCLRICPAKEGYNDTQWFIN